MNKPIPVKPIFYAHVFEQLRRLAKKYGYNLLLNGSLNRDLDLVAIPWTDNPKDEFEMIKHFELRLTGFYSKQKEHYMFSILPGGRKSYVINLNRGGAWNHYQDKQYYLDISITPFFPSNLWEICNKESESDKIIKKMHEIDPEKLREPYNI